MKTFAKQCKLCMLAFKGKPRKPRRPLHFGLVAFGITLARARSKFEFHGGTIVHVNSRYIVSYFRHVSHKMTCLFC